jgi:hypothetical protein
MTLAVATELLLVFYIIYHVSLMSQHVASRLNIACRPGSIFLQLGGIATLTCSRWLLCSLPVNETQEIAQDIQAAIKYQQEVTGVWIRP